MYFFSFCTQQRNADETQQTFSPEASPPLRSCGRQLKVVLDAPLTQQRQSNTDSLRASGVTCRAARTKRTAGLYTAVYDTSFSSLIVCIFAAACPECPWYIDKSLAVGRQANCSSVIASTRIIGHSRYYRVSQNATSSCEINIVRRDTGYGTAPYFRT